MFSLCPANLSYRINCVICIVSYLGYLFVFTYSYYMFIYICVSCFDLVVSTYQVIG